MSFFYFSSTAAFLSILSWFSCYSSFIFWLSCLLITVIVFFFNAALTLLIRRSFGSSISTSSCICYIVSNSLPLMPLATHCTLNSLLSCRVFSLSFLCLYLILATWSLNTFWGDLSIIEFIIFSHIWVYLRDCFYICWAALSRLSCVLLNLVLSLPTEGCTKFVLG